MCFTWLCRLSWTMLNISRASAATSRRWPRCKQHSCVSSSSDWFECRHCHSPTVAVMIVNDVIEDRTFELHTGQSTHTHHTHTHTVALNRLTVNWLIVQCLRYSSQLRRWTHKVHTSLILAVIHASLVERHRAKIVPVHQKDVIYSWTHPRHLMWIAQCWNWSYQACREWLKIGEVCLLRISKHVNSMMDCIMTDLCTVIISCWHVFAVSVLCDLLNDRKAFVNDC